MLAMPRFFRRGTQHQNRLAWLFLLTCLHLAGCSPNLGDEVAASNARESGDSTTSRSGRLRVGDVLGQAGGQSGEFASATEARTFDFPADHGAHPDYQTEWWYLTGVLRDNTGREFGFQYTLFRYGLFVASGENAQHDWRNGQMYMAHLAISDVAQARHHGAQRLVRGHPRLAGVTVEPWLQTWLEDWRFKQTAEQSFNLEAFEDARFGLTLELNQERPLRLQGEAGLSHKGMDSASYYYSLPRLRASGQVMVDGESYEVEGRAWLDREWSTSVLEPGVKGWSWFALHFDAGSPFADHDLMAFTMQREDGARHAYDHGQLSNASQGRVLTKDDFELRPIKYWSDSSGGRWPVAWEMTLHQGLTKAQMAERLTIEAVFDDQLMDDSFVYWEGMVVVRDGSNRRVGDGYMELTGYQSGG